MPRRCSSTGVRPGRGSPSPAQKAVRITLEAQKETKVLNRQRLRTFVLGGAVGALVGILLAPRSGKELRGSLANRAGEARERGRETYFDAQDHANAPRWSTSATPPPHQGGLSDPTSGTCRSTSSPRLLRRLPTPRGPSSYAGR